MSDTDEPAANRLPLDEVREAAGAVIVSLRHLLEVTERVVEDPAAFAEVVDGGRAFVEGFVGGLSSSMDSDSQGDGSATKS